MILGPPAIVSDPLQVTARVRPQRAPALGELLLSEQASLDSLGQLDLLLGVEQRHFADLLEVVLHRIGRGTRRGYLRGGKVIVIVTVDECLVLGLLAGGLHRGGRDGSGRWLGGRRCLG